MIFTVILSTFAEGMPGRSSASKRLLRSRTELAIRDRARDLERADPRRRISGLIREGRRGRHDARKWEPEDVGERGVGLGQRDPYLTGLVVGLDPWDVGARLAALDVLLGALDALVERRAPGLEVQHALDRVLEVGGLHRLAVRVLKALPQPELVGTSVGADLGERFGQAGD